MTDTGGPRRGSRARRALLAALVMGTAACTTGGPSASDGAWAPGVDRSKPAVDGVEVGHRLMAAGEHELAIDAFTRAALDRGMTTEILTGLGSAYLGLGRLGQAEDLLRRAVDEDPDWPEAWNNLGVVLMEQGKIPEAQNTFRKAYALDNGESDAIRDNLRLSLAKSENRDMKDEEKEDYRLVRRGAGEFLIRPAP